jgi:hypothetical protein
MHTKRLRESQKRNAVTFFQTHYDHLQVSRTACNSVIRSAYKALCQQYHPDKNPNGQEHANRKMKMLNEAYQVLSDRESRARYDAWLAKQENEVSCSSGMANAHWGKKQQDISNKEGGQRTYTPPSTTASTTTAAKAGRKENRYALLYIAGLVAVAVFIMIKTAPSKPWVFALVAGLLSIYGWTMMRASAMLRGREWAAAACATVITVSIFSFSWWISKLDADQRRQQEQQRLIAQRYNEAAMQIPMEGGNLKPGVSLDQRDYINGVLTLKKSLDITGMARHRAVDSTEEEILNSM